MSSCTGHRLEAFSSLVQYPSAAHPRLMVTITITLRSPFDGGELGRDALGEASILDVTDDSLAAIGAELGTARLSPALATPARPALVRGLLFGHCFRVFVPLSVELHGRALNVLFLVDTGAAATRLRMDTWSALLPVGSPIPGLTQTIFE